MRCNKFIENFLELDNYTAIPLSFKIHIFFCTRCRKEILFLTEQFKSLLATSSFDMKKDISEAVMLKIKELEINFEQNISNFKWITAGSIIWASIFLMSFSDSIAWLQSQFGAYLEIPLRIVMGLVVSFYAALYIGTHLDQIKKALNYNQK